MSDFTGNVELLVTDVQVQKIHKVHHIKVAISNEMSSTYRNGLSSSTSSPNKLHFSKHLGKRMPRLLFIATFSYLSP